MSAPLLEVKDLTKAFGGIRAVDNLSFTVAPDAITGIIGPNGAGKTTVFNLVTGVYRADSGSIDFEGRSILSIRPNQIVGPDARLPDIRLFKRLLPENVLTPMSRGPPTACPRPPLRTPGPQARFARLRKSRRAWRRWG